MSYNTLTKKGGFSMSKIAYIIDSTTLLDEKYKKLPIEIVQLNVNTETQSFHEDQLDDEKTMELINNNKGVKSSSPSSEDFLCKYNELFAKGFQDIIVVPLSKGLSGTLQVANIAKQTLNDEQQKHIHIVDTNFCNYANANLFDACYSLISDENSTVEEILNKFDEVIKNGTTLFTVFDLKHLFRGGRLNRISCAVGILLRIKPVVKMVDGKLVLFKKFTLHNKVHTFFMEEIEKYSKQYDKVFLKVVHLNTDDQYNKLCNEVKEKYKNVIMTDIAKIGPVFTVHLGNIGIGITLTGYNETK